MQERTRILRPHFAACPQVSELFWISTRVISLQGAGHTASAPHGESAGGVNAAQLSDLHHYDPVLHCLQPRCGGVRSLEGY